MDLQGGPTFEDLSIDDELTQLQRLVRYSSSSIALQRLVHVKMLSETVAAVGFEQTVKEVVPLLAPLAEDQELVVRQHLGEQLEEIARFCRLQGKEAGYRLIIEIVLPTLAKLLGDPQAEVRQAAGESLVGVANLMKPIDLGHHVLTIVLQLAHDDEQAELRMTAAALLNDLAEALGFDLCQQFVTPEMESLSEDPVFRVRKATALNLDKVIKVVGDVGIKRLLPAYVRLTQDDVYRVRKACTEALVEMSKAVGAEVSLRELTPAFLTLASDSSKLVRTGALQHLGRLISTLPGESVSEDLVRYFTGTAVESMGDPVADAELRLYCAFSFPAVVITIGPDRWHELRESYALLTRDPSWSVRKTLSFSLHEIAKVLKPEDVESDLVPAMEAFLRDMEDVRLGVIRQLADFFREMKPEQREKHLNVLVEILQTTSPFNWRLREVLAQQLPRLAPLLTPDSVFFAVVPVAFGLLNDPVAVVREKTFEVVAPLLQLAGAHSGARQASMVSRVRELAHAHTYQARQMYVYICHSMACSANVTHERPLFIQEFVPSLAELATDSVVNVRIAMSRALSKCPDWVMELPDIRRAIHHLVKDSNPDVRHFVSFLPPILRSDLSQEEKQQPGQETSSVLSDESVLTQWSMSTQRSMLSVGDFPPPRDASSPNSTKSIKLGRQRSSSVESVGESGYSTTSEEGEGLKRLTLRRPPLPAGWGLPAVSSAEPPPEGEGGGDSGSAAGAADVTAAEAAEAEPKAEDSDLGVTGSSADGSATPPADVGWGAAGGADGEGLLLGAAEPKGAEGGEDGGRGEGGGGQQGGAVVSSEADALMFGLQAAAAGTAEARDEGRDDLLPALPPSPKRASSQDLAVVGDDGDDAEAEVVAAAAAAAVAAAATEEEPAMEEDASLTAKIAELTLSADAAGLAVAAAAASPGGMVPTTPTPTAPFTENRGSPLKIAAPMGLRQGSPGFGVQGADPAGAAESGGVSLAGTTVVGQEGSHPATAAAGIGDYPQQRGGLNLTPPPWEGSERRDLGAAAAAAAASLPVLPVEVDVPAASSLRSENAAVASAPPAKTAASTAAAAPLVLPKGEKSLVPPKGEKSLVPPKGEKSLVPPKGEKSLVPPKGEKSLVPPKGEKSQAAPIASGSETKPEGLAGGGDGVDGVARDQQQAVCSSPSEKGEGPPPAAGAGAGSGLSTDGVELHVGGGVGGAAEEKIAGAPSPPPAGSGSPGRSGDGEGVEEVGFGVVPPLAEEKGTSGTVSSPVAVGEGSASVQPVAAPAAAAAAAAAAATPPAAAITPTPMPAATPTPAESATTAAPRQTEDAGVAGSSAAGAATAGAGESPQEQQKSVAVAVPAPAGSGKGVGGDPQPLTAAAAVSSPSAEGGAADGKSSVGGQGQQDPGIVGHKSGDAEGVAGAGVGVRDPQRDEGDETRRAWSKESE